MKRRMGAVLVGLLTLLYAGIAAAEGRVPLEELLFDKGILTKDEAASVQKRKISSVIDRITFSGDMRLRQESFWRSEGLDDVHRQRFRLRLGADLKLDTITVGIRLASGTGDQVSTNQSFDNLSSQKPLWIDRAYIRWQGESPRWLTLTGGRMPNPFLTVYSSDAVWDEDLNLEGVAENFAWKLGGTDLFLNMAQIVLDSDSAGAPNTDQWLFGQQVGMKVKPLAAVQTTVAAAYYNTVNAQNGNFGQVNTQDGNSPDCTPTPPATTCTRGTLVNDYNVVNLTAIVSTTVGALPISVMGDYVTNTADTKASSSPTAADTKNNGYQAGVILGKASDPRTWELAYFHKVLGTDATLADLADSDFGSGGTNREGNIVWAAYNPNKALQVKAKWFKTEAEDGKSPPSGNGDQIDRLQLDLSVKF